MAAVCDETPALAFVVSTIGISLAGCVFALVVACRARTFGLRLTACFALSVLIGLPVWLLPTEWCTSQALLEEFSYLSSMLWAVICLLHVYLVVNTGLRVAWRFEAFAHAVGWGVPLLSTAWLWRTGTIGMGELGVCWIGEQHVAARVLFFFAPLGLCAGVLLVLLGFVSFKMTRGEAAQPADVSWAAMQRGFMEARDYSMLYLGVTLCRRQGDTTTTLATEAEVEALLARDWSQLIGSAVSD